MAQTTRQTPPRRPINPNGSASVPPRETAPRRQAPPPKQIQTKKQNTAPQSDTRGLFGTPPFTIVHYGPPKVGKTSLWSYLPKVGVVYDPKEEGIVDLYSARQCPQPHWEQEVDDFEKLIEVLSNVANQEYGIENLVLDSMTGMELLCFHYHCREYFEGNWTKEGFYAFQQGPKNAAKTDWPRLLDAIDAVRKSGISVVFIGHSQVKTQNNPVGPDYDQYMPIIDKETWAQTARWAKCILFQTFDLSLVSKGKGGNIKEQVNKKAKALGTGSRLLYTQPAAGYVAGNRWGLEDAIDLGETPEESYNAFISAYRKAWNV